MAKEVNKCPYREELIDYVKLAAQTIMDNADAIVANVDYVSDFNIDISFRQDCGSVPEITVSVSMLPDPHKIQEILEKHHPIRVEYNITKEKEN